MVDPVTGYNCAYDFEPEEEYFCTCTDSDLCPGCHAAMYAARAPWTATDGTRPVYLQEDRQPLMYAEAEDGFLAELAIDDALMERPICGARTARKPVDFERLGRDLAARGTTGRRA